jgi:hypothetical protein
VLTSLVALTGWKAIGAIAALFGVIAPTVHALFEFLERPDHQSLDGHALVVRRSRVAPNRFITSKRSTAR